MRLFVSLFLVIGALSKPISADKLDVAIANAIFSDTSPLCKPIDSHTTFSSVYTPSGSYWNFRNAEYEEDAFEIEMRHSDQNENRTWTMRLGKGGQVVSFIGPYGEVIPTQAQDKSAWNDLVTQPVAVSDDLNTPTNPYFIHGSGPYMKDEGMPPPFYNPKVAMHCSENECTMVNWGQQAHVPTPHRSDLLYYARFRDCGNGIIEYDTAFHNFGDSNSAQLTYFNTPWTGVRTSTLHDMLISNASGTLEHEHPLKLWGSANIVRNLDTTGGFTTFAEDLTSDDDTFDAGFCMKNGVKVACNEEDAVPFEFVVQNNNSAQEHTYHSQLQGKYTIVANFCDSDASIFEYAYDPDGYFFINERTNFTMEVSSIVHFCYHAGNNKQTLITPNETASTVNREFLATDRIIVKTNIQGKRDEDNLALTFVHGKNPEFPSNNVFHYRAKSRMRYGTTGSARDGTVWTTNYFGTLSSSETYINRKYMITGRLLEMETTSASYEEETFEDRLLMADLNPGEDITLYYDDNAFGAAIGSETCPGQTLACVGSSTPKANNYAPLFYMTCGGSSYVGSDQYKFARTSSDVALRPFLCADETNSIRPEYKLLGYFEEDNCSVIENHQYAADFACHVAAPTASPVSSSPSDSPSSSVSPSGSPSGVPSLSSEPSSIPSSVPSLTTDSPSSSVSPSGSPSGVPSLSSEPSSIPSSVPSLTVFPSLSPTTAPIASPSSSSNHMIVCGRTGRCGSLESKFESDTEEHEVRCCSDSAISGWKKRNGCNVWGGSKVGEDLECYSKQTFASATELCEAAGAASGADARLCTKDELEDDCTQGTGCGHDGDLIWSSTDDTPTTGPSASPSSSSNHMIVCGRTGGCGNLESTSESNDGQHEVRCCSDSEIAGWTKRDGCKVWGGSKVGANFQCYHNQNFESATELCEAAGAAAGAAARLCTQGELEGDCTKHTGCGHDGDLIWTSTTPS